MGDIHIGSSPGTAGAQAYAGYNPGFGFNPALSYAATVGSDPSGQGLFSNYNYGSDGVGLDAAIGPFSGAGAYAMGYDGGFGGFGMPFGGGFGMYGGGNPVQQMQLWNQYNNSMIDMQTDNNVHRLEQQRYAETKMQGPVSVVNHHKELLTSLIAEERYDQVLPEYMEYKNAIRKLYPPGTDEKVIEAVANEQFPIASELGVSNPFLENVKKGLGFGIGAIFTSGRDSRDLRAEITGVPTTFRDKLTKVAGWAVGALLTVAGIALFRRANPASWKIFQKGTAAVAKAV